MRVGLSGHQDIPKQAMAFVTLGITQVVATTEDDLEKFRLLLQRAETVEKLPFHKPSEDAFFAAGRRVVENSDILLAVWDGKPAKGKGGTADIVEYARKRG